MCRAWIIRLSMNRMRPHRSHLRTIRISCQLLIAYLRQGQDLYRGRYERQHGVLKGTGPHTRDWRKADPTRWRSPVQR